MHTYTNGKLLLNINQLVDQIVQNMKSKVNK